MVIIGAGLSGLLCGALNPGSVIYEAGSDRESDHKALFRCKTDQIGKLLGIPFKKVEVHKGLWDNGHIEPSIRSAHMYSQKVTGKITGRSIMNLEPGIRYIPPDDFVERLKEKCTIEYNSPFNSNALHDWKNTPIISTIPMLVMAKMMGRLHMDGIFDSKPIFVNRIPIQNCDSYCTIYYPGRESSIYRASLTGNTLIVESTMLIDHNAIVGVFESLGLPIPLHADFDKVLTNIKQQQGKIYPIDEKIRQEFISKLTLYDNIYSLGRFATWRPKVMLDDVLEDIFVIRRLIEGGNYASLHHKQGEK